MTSAALVSPSPRGRLPFVPVASTRRCARTFVVACLLLAWGVSQPAEAKAPAEASSRRGWAHPWAADAVVYGVIPPLFGKQPLQDVKKRLPQLRELGVNTLWLSPINETIPGDFGYSVTSYFDLRPDYGTKADLRELVSAAHSMGMKVIMDFVPNHTAREHAFFQDALTRGKDSPYFGFYDWKSPGEPAHYFDWTHLPNLNFRNDVVDDMIVDALEYWVRDFDIDGYRVDVAWGVQERDAKLWSRLRTALERIKPDVFLLAEATAKDPIYFRRGFDAAYDWTEKPGHWAWEKVWEPRNEIASRLRAILRDAETPPAGMVARFLNNNDTAERFITRHGPELTRTAAALMLTLPGLPTLYTGDEVGAEYLPYQEPPPLSWNDPHRLKPHYERLVSLRHQLPALRRPTFDLLETDTPTALAYLRPAGKGELPVLVVLNFSGEPRTVQVTLPTPARKSWGAPVDVLHGSGSPASPAPQGIRVQLAPWGARILTPTALENPAQ